MIDPNIKAGNIKMYPVFEQIAKGDHAQGFDENGKEVHLIFIAPIDLEKGDKCTVDINDGYLFKVERNDKTIWSDIAWNIT